MDDSNKYPRRYVTAEGWQYLARMNFNARANVNLMTNGEDIVIHIPFSNRAKETLEKITEKETR